MKSSFSSSFSKAGAHLCETQNVLHKVDQCDAPKKWQDIDFLSNSPFGKFQHISQKGSKISCNCVENIIKKKCSQGRFMFKQHYKYFVKNKGCKYTLKHKIKPQDRTSTSPTPKSQESGSVCGRVCNASKWMKSQSFPTIRSVVLIDAASGENTD